MEFKISDGVRRRLFGLAIPAGGGLTPLVDRLKAVDLVDKSGKSGPAGQSFQILDEAWALEQIHNVDEFLDNSASKSLRLYPALLRLLKEVLEQNPAEALIFGTHDPDFLEFAGIKPKRTAIMLPTRDFFVPIQDQLLATYEAEIPKAKSSDARASLRQAYLDEIQTLQSSAYDFALRYGGEKPAGAAYSTLDQLEANVIAAFGLTKTTVASSASSVSA